MSTETTESLEESARQFDDTFRHAAFPAQPFSLCGIRVTPSNMGLDYVPEGACPICLALYNDWHAQNR